ncbi:unnamed protein product [Coregonus sp. 'balchen']|nr:unnamed protein product [Coregonus sp. 'balchen']
MCVTTEPSAFTFSTHQRDTGPPGTTGHQELDIPESCVDPEDTHSGLISEKIQPTPEKTDRAPGDTLSLPAQWRPISKTTGPENKPTESVSKDITKETVSVTEKSELITKATVSLPETSSVTMETGPASVKSSLATKETGEVPVNIGSVTKEIQSVPETTSVTKMTGSATGSRAEGTGGGFDGLREIEVCTASLRRLRHRASGLSSTNSKEGGYPMLDRELYTALCAVEHSLETLTGLLLSPSMTTMEDSQLRLLQIELSEAPETIAQCVTCLHGCLQTAQSALTSSLSRLHTQLGHNQAGMEQQESHVCVYDEIERGQSDPFTHIKDVPMLEYIVGRCPEDAVELQRVSQALLQGVASLVALGRERLADCQDRPPHSRTQLQTLLSRHKKLYQVMGSQLALVQRLFQCGPQGGLVGQEEEQRVLALLEECKPALGSVLDQEKALQAWGCSTGVGGTGGVLELRWRAIRGKAEQESQRSCDIRDNWNRFHKDSVSLTGWMGSAKERLKTWTSLPDATPQDEELTRIYLIQLLEFSVELETKSAEKASALRAGTLLLQLKEADAPCLRRQLAQLEQTWTEVTSALPIAQERLHQLLLERWPPCQVLSGLEAWVKETEARLEEQGQATSKACHDADQLRHILQYYQGCQAGSASGQLTLDFLCQSGPQSVAASDNSARCSEERTLFAEQMGALNLSWLLLEGKLGSQVRHAEELFHTCADREKRLRRVLSWAEGERKKLREWQRPVSQTQVDKALLEWEAVEEKLKDVFVEVEDLVQDTWSADTVNQVCTNLNQQVGSLRPALQRVRVQWGQFEKELGDVSLYTTRLRCGLEHSSGPLLSSHQVKRHVEQLQVSVME